MKYYSNEIDKSINYNNYLIIKTININLNIVKKKTCKA